MEEEHEQETAFVEPKTEEDVAEILKTALKTSNRSKKDVLNSLRAELITVKALQEAPFHVQILLWIISPSTIIFILLPIVMAIGLMAGVVKLSFKSAMDGDTCLTSWLSLDQVSLPAHNCEFCVNITGALRLSNLSKTEFVTKYAYSGIPIVVTDATDSWKARKVFSYEFFKNLYLKNPRALDNDHNEGQFFAYRSDLNDLYDLFSLPEDRSTLEGGKKWYIGWSTENELIGKQLKKYFSTPYFIHPQSDSEEGLKVSWIFMGAPGPGAFMHLDSVTHSSWQAQLKGTKTWTLAPQPECEAVCETFNITVNTGDMIVLNTNLWYHSTYIHPGSISITIGNEFE